MAMKVRALILIVLASTMLWFAGCGHYVCHTTFGSSTCTPGGGGLGGGGGTTAFIYFMDDKAGQIAAEGLDVGGDGLFAPLAGFVSPTLPAPPIGDGGLVIVSKKYLYMPLANGTLYAYSIDGATGALTPLATPTYTVSGSSIAADPAGQFLFVGDFSGISVFTVSAADGSLTKVAGSPFSTGGVAPIQMTTDGLGKYLYAAGGSEILAFSYSATGLTTVPGSPFTGTGFNMTELAGESTGKFMVGVTGLTDSNAGAVDDHVYLFAISTTTPGALTAASGSPYSTNNPPEHVAVSPNGQFVYAFTQTTSGTITTLDPIEGFQLLSTGTLQNLSTSPFTALLGNKGKFEQSGQFLFMVGETTNSQNQGSVPLGVDSTTGALGDTLGGAGAPSLSFAVTDAP